MIADLTVLHKWGNRVMRGEKAITYITYMYLNEIKNSKLSELII